MRYLSVCSGIEAATVAWHPLGWQPAAFSEIETFPSAVLAHHYPHVPNMGDMTKFKEWNLDPIDLLVGGTPCQSFSVAGLRKGLDDPRGNLMLTYLAIADKYCPRWLVWENVPGVLSSNGGKDFGTFLGGLGELGYGFAYRVLDAQYFGVAQRRRRVFVVGCLGDWRRAAAVLFERHSLQGHPAPSRSKGKGTAYGFAGGAVDGIAKPLGAHSLSKGRGTDLDNSTYISFNFNKSGNDASSMGIAEDRTDCLRADTKSPFAVAFQGKASATNSMNPSECAPTLDKGKADGMSALIGAAVRRLTPEECELLQGFKRGYTLVPIPGQAGRRRPALQGSGQQHGRAGNALDRQQNSDGRRGAINRVTSSMSVTVETATVYRGGGRRWLSLKAACNAEARAIMKAKDKPRCECDEPEYEGPLCYYPGNTCELHQEARYEKRYRRLARMIYAAARTK